MNKIPLIIKREYLTRVKKKSFIIMTIVGPILMAALFIAPVWLGMMDDNEKKTISVYDESGKYKNAFEDTETLTFRFLDEPDIKKREQDFLESGNYAMLTISDTIKNEFVLYSEKAPDLSVKEQITGRMERFVEAENFKKLGINKAEIDSAKVDIYLETYTLTEEGVEKSSAELGIAIGFISAFVIYIFIFMYGVQVMKGVIEEKINRVVEVLISSVKPFQLMAGKIIGIALVALTQFVLWAVLTGVIVSFVYFAFGESMMPQGQDLSQIQNMSTQQMEELVGNNQFSDLIVGLINFNWFAIISTFLVFFAGGYLLYSSLFAAIGAAVDNETDTQQFMLPVTVPLILAIVSAQGIVKNPDGTLAFWLSIIPFTSPIIMPLRVAMGRYEVWELLLSAGLLTGAFIATVWLAAKIYKVGILMYGKKVSYKELWKWLRYK
ncbi:MAG: ABC transporter permease [Bacteroidales bacterium]|nr:ABC transporter permease [Bacteroidales bacterium]